MLRNDYLAVLLVLVGLLALTITMCVAAATQPLV